MKGFAFDIKKIFFSLEIGNTVAKNITFIKKSSEKFVDESFFF